MTNTNYELTIGGKLRKVYKNSGGFFVKINGGNLNVNNYFLKNGSGLKLKYKTKGGDADGKGIFNNLVDIKFIEKGNPVTVMVNSIIDHLNSDIKNLNGTISAEKIIMFIYYKLFNEAKKNDIDELKTLIEYVLFSFHDGYTSLDIKSKENEKDLQNKMKNYSGIDKVIEVAIKNKDNFKNKSNINWINELFDEDGNIIEAAAKEAPALASAPSPASASASEELAAKEAPALASAPSPASAENQTVSPRGGKNKNKNKSSSKNYLKKKLSNNKK